MRRFFRILFAMFAGVSLLVCVAAAGVWVRGYLVGDHFRHSTSTRSWGVRVGHGRVTVARWDQVTRSAVGMKYDVWEHADTPPAADLLPPSPQAETPRDVALPGFARREYVDDFLRLNAVVIHLAHPTTLFALVPLAWSAGFVRRRRRARRARAGLCAHCGYDLRASPGRCPECGVVGELKTRDHG